LGSKPPECVIELGDAQPDARFACEVFIGRRIELDEIFNFAAELDEKNAEDFVKNARG